MPRTKPSDLIAGRMTGRDHAEIMEAEKARNQARIHLKKVRDRIRTRIALAIAKEQGQ